MHDVNGLLNQQLGAGNISGEAFGVVCRVLFQGPQPHIDARQRLGDHIVQFAADLLALLLLGRKKLARE